MFRRSVLGAGLTLSTFSTFATLATLSTLGALAPVAAQAQAWPNKPVKIIVPAAAGLPPDILVRSLATQLESKIGQSVVVENRPGANTILGAQTCAAAPADGYTFCLAVNDTISVNPYLYSKLPYDPEKSFTPVAMLGWPNSVIVANQQSGIKSLKEAIEQSKAKPGSLNWGSFGNGSSSHLYLEWIRSRTNWDVTHVAYNGTPAVPTLANQVQLTYLTVGALKPHIDSGKMVPLVVAGAKRSTFLPNVPTFSEVGLGEVFIRTWFGLFAPAGTPAQIVTDMNKHIVAITNDPGYRSKTLDMLTISPSQETPAEMQAFLKKDREVTGEIMKAIKVKLD